MDTIKREITWGEFKNELSGSEVFVEMRRGGQLVLYTISGSVVTQCSVWVGGVPWAIVAAGYSQNTNDQDLNEITQLGYWS